MTAQPAYSLRKALSHIVGDMARALAERRDETTAVRVARTNAAVHMILGFMPRDVIETVLAGHCVMFHEMIVDGVRGMFLSETAATRRSERGGIVAMDKCFINNLDRLRRSQLQPDRSRAEEAGATAVPAAAEGSARDAAIDAKVSAAMTAANIREAARFTPPPVEAVEPGRDARPPAAPAMDEPSLAGLDEADTLGDEAFAAFSANPAAKTALEAVIPLHSPGPWAWRNRAKNFWPRPTRRAARSIVRRPGMARRRVRQRPPNPRRLGVNRSHPTRLPRPGNLRAWRVPDQPGWRRRSRPRTIRPPLRTVRLAGSGVAVLVRVVVSLR